MSRIFGALRAANGSGTILAIGVVSAVVAIVSMLVTVSVALAVKQKTIAAADSTALAAADTASGLLPGYPCEAASRTAEINGMTLTACSLEGIVATTSVSTHYLGLLVTASARAGPPGA